MLRSVLLASCLVVVVVACGDSTKPLATAKPGIIFSYPINGQNDVPVGSRIVVTFSEKVTASALGPCTTSTGAFCVVGPGGPVDAMPTVSEDGTSVSFVGPLEPGTTYQVFTRSELAPFAENLPAGTTPLFSFTTRSDRPRAAAPTLVSINGGDPAKVGTSFRPMLETTTLRLLFSEPLDPRSIKLGAGGFELLDNAGIAVPALIVCDGIHVSIDPKTDLTAGANYTLRLGNQIVDMGGQPLAPTTATITPAKSRTGTPVMHVLKTLQDGDPGFGTTRAGAKPNTISVEKPLTGRMESAFQPTALIGEIHDPKALGGPIAFTLRKGQRLSTTALDVKFGGVVPSGLTTGDVMIELLTDATGRLYRNPYQPAEQRPENADSPLFVDLSMDVAIYTKDPAGNAVITQTVLGMQATGTAIGTDGALVIETVSSMELGMLGVTKAPSNLVLSLFSEGPGTGPAADTDAPTLVVSNPDQSGQAAVDQGIELTFSEPIDLDRARAGGIKLQDSATNADIAAVIESHGAGVVVRPLQPLAYGNKIYRVVMSDVADVAGNKASVPNLTFTTPVLSTTDTPAMPIAIHPGVPCTLTGATSSSPGRCNGGDDTDDLYKPFTIGKDEPVDVLFSEPLRRSSITLGTQCGQGSVRVEETDAGGGCLSTVPGTLIKRERELVFIPDVPWADGKHYKVTYAVGGNDTCDAGELCDLIGAVNMDPLYGMGNGTGGGSNLVIPFTLGPPTDGTYMMNYAAPFTDINGSGTLDPSELKRMENHATLKITDTDGSINGADFDPGTCDTSTDSKTACMYLIGAMPVVMGGGTTTCPLPNGGSAASCVPVYMSAQSMFGTNVTMGADVGITISSSTNIQSMRIREPSSGGVMGYIVDDGAGKAKLVLSLDLYMDAPDMSLPPFTDHDLHSKQLKLDLEGPVTFSKDGRINIALANISDLPITVAINGPLSGHVMMVIPKGEMKLQLVSTAPRGVSLQ